MTDNAVTEQAAMAEPSQRQAVRQPLQVDLSGLRQTAAVHEAASDPKLLRKSRLGFSESFGAAAWLLSHDPVYRNVSLHSLEAAAGAPIRLGQFRIFRKEAVPFAYASWAYLSEDVETRVKTGGTGLRPDEWQSGDRLWLVDLVAPFGGLELAQEEIRETVFKNKNFQHLSAQRQADRAGDLTAADSAELDFASLDIVASEAADAGKHIKIIRADEKLRKMLRVAALPFVRLFVSAGAFKGMNLDTGKIRDLVTRLIERPDAVLVVALYRGIPCGGFAGEMVEFGFGRDHFAQEIAFILHPRFRGKGIGRRLLAEFESWGREKGAVWLQYMQASELEPEAAEAVYMQSGARRAGYIYRKELRSA